MSVILIHHAQMMVTMDSERRELADGALVIVDRAIEFAGSSADAADWLVKNNQTPDQCIDAQGCLVLPGLVNCHHHLYQTLTRSIGTSAGKSLFDWLQALYPIWAEMDGEAVYISARLALVELLLSGATTVADHLYLFPNGAMLDDEIRAAQELGGTLPSDARKYESG